MSLRTRKTNIRNLIPQVRSLVYKHSVPTEFEVPGSKPHTLYHVWLSEKPLKKVLCNGTVYYEYRCTCHDKSQLDQFPPCPGNSASGNRRDTICKHCVAALINRLERKQVSVSICDWSENGSDIDNARRVLRLGGSLIKLVSNQGNGQVWLVGKRSMEKPTIGDCDASEKGHSPDTSKLSLKERSVLLHLPDENGID